MKKLVVCAVAVAVALVGCSQGERRVALVENGVAKCRVVLSDDASLPEKFGAKELAKYFSKATGCGELNGPYEIAIDCRDRRDGLDPWQEGEFEIDSAATSTEELGNDVHAGTRRKLEQAGVPCGHHAPRALPKAPAFTTPGHVCGLAVHGAREGAILPIEAAALPGRRRLFPVSG